ncbi:hypothetical protein [Micromonospora chersina]|uniref:Uncharacterized protein n=1 Tax=Micromonospora chersina TaxID=47854 RepID=A0A1C6VEG2_9ACTN|nr:hypothetical protein [Micromonospora chersina]SCL64732.1 hypothetical protein GA0070603_3837 [Micromonospora chersina]
MSTGKPAAKNRAAAWAVWLTIGLVVAGCVAAGVLNNDGDTTVAAPAADERADSVAILKRTSAEQGLCYGWELVDYYDYGDPLNVGSNLGDGVAVEDNPACPRWVQVTANIGYVSESSESNDFARIQVTGSPDIDSADLWQVERGLERLGLTEDVFVDDPGWAVTRAAVMLPLLAVEAGLAEPADTPVPAAASPSPLPDAGSDLLRDRWGWLAATVGLVLLAALFVTVGVVQRRRTTAPGRGAAPDAPSRSGRKRRVVVPAQRAGAGAAGRTREKA